MKVILPVMLLLALAVPALAQDTTTDTRPLLSLDRFSGAVAVRYCGFSTTGEGSGVNMPGIDKEFIAGIPIAYSLTKHLKLTGSGMWGFDSHLMRWEAGINVQLFGEKR